MNWYNQILKNFYSVEDEKIEWVKCPKCENIVSTITTSNLNICEHCEACLYLTVDDRIHLLTDHSSFKEYNQDMTSKDIIDFEDTQTYTKRLKKYKKTSGRNSSVVTGSCTINSIPVQIAIMDFKFMGGSLGSIEGEKITLAIENAISKKTGVLIVSSSGGARMQESTYSLMQMTKTSAALKRLSNKGLPYISLLTNPTMGGVSASFAMLGDVIISEPKAVIGFAGKRVIEQTIRNELPLEFQTAEFLLEHGLIDSIVKRQFLKTKIGNLFEIFNNNIDCTDPYDEVIPNDETITNNKEKITVDSFEDTNGYSNNTTSKEN